MKIGSLVTITAVLACGAFAAALRVTAAGPVACEALGQVALANATVISAVSVQAGGFSPPGSVNAAAAGPFATLQAFCRVTARLTPTADSDIRVEVWLPLSGWNRKVQAAGNGGLGGKSRSFDPSHFRLQGRQGGSQVDLFQVVGALSCFRPASGLSQRRR